MNELTDLISHRFSRAEPRRLVISYMEGLLSSELRKTAFALASRAREVGPDGMQRLLRTAKWDADAVRDDLRAYVLRNTRVPEVGQGDRDRPVLVTAQQTFVKKGRHSAGTAWQYSSEHGRMENCQIGLFLSYVSEHGTSVLDRELYLPREWLRDRSRGMSAVLPQRAQYASKARLNQQMIARVLDGGPHLPWVSVPERELWDEDLRLWLEERGVPYVLKLNPEDTAALLPRGMADDLLAPPPGGRTAGVNTLPWQTVRLRGPAAGRRAHWLLIHQPTAPSRRPQSYLCAGHSTTVTEFIRAVRAQATTQRCLAVLRTEVGLDAYQVRTITGWYRHTTLSLLAHAFRSFSQNRPLREPVHT
ncbi:IS701 family transposase [Streptomyces ossamyceticus]|uniref:IS701 family transposase n=1 Tax=Streptomyces ossamyceticus TaxID=249581 RepID=UPI0036EA4AA5